MISARVECRPKYGKNFIADVTETGAGSRAVDAYANRHRCITELSTVRCVRDKVSRSSSASTDPGRNRPGTTDMQRLCRLCFNVPNVKRIQHVYTDYLRADEIKRITRRRRTIIFSNPSSDIISIEKLDASK